MGHDMQVINSLISALLVQIEVKYISNRFSHIFLVFPVKLGRLSSRKIYK